MADIAGHPYWQVHSDAAGGLDAVGTGLPDAVPAAGVTDLFVMSHGWGSSEQNAENLYQGLFGQIAAAVGRVPTAGPQRGTIVFVGVFWP